MLHDYIFNKYLLSAYCVPDTFSYTCKKNRANILRVKLCNIINTFSTFEKLLLSDNRGQLEIRQGFYLHIAWKIFAPVKFHQLALLLFRGKAHTKLLR